MVVHEAPRRAEWLVLAGLTVLAAVNVLWDLGSSSLFIDEGNSVDIALHPLGDILDGVKVIETSPPTYFYGLHEWIGRLGSRADWFVRLPSALAAIALVPAVWWVGRRMGGRAVGLVAAAACTLNPYVLNYGQQARMYALLMLAATLATGAALRAVVATGRARTAWLAASGALALVAGALHYTGLVPAAVLAVWVLTRSELGRAARVLYAAAPVVLAAALLPLARDQFDRYPNGGLRGLAGLTWENAVKVLGSPWDGRALTGLDAQRYLGLAAALAGLTFLGSPRARATLADRWLLASLAAAPLVLVFAGGLAGKDALISRYTSAAVPFMLIALAAVIVRAPRPVGGLVAVAALAASVAGIVTTHRPSGRFADARGAVAAVRAGLKPGDAVLIAGDGIDLPVLREGIRDPARPLPFVFVASQPERVAAAVAERRRLWAISSLPQDRAAIAAALKPLGYRLVSVRRLEGNVALFVVLVGPAR